MNPFRSPLRYIAPLAVALVTLAAGGCSKKINGVDPGYTSPEGRTSSSAQQILYPDFPATVALYRAAPANCDTCTDALISVDPAYPTGAGVFNGMIFDGTAASTYQILRRESGGGYAPLFDYVLNPVERFPQSGWKLFNWQDARPSTFTPPSYLGRGIVSGVFTPATPLTNVSTEHEGALREIHLTTDSLRSFTYTPVPGAVGYVMQVYAIKNGYPEALLYNAAPAPLASQDHRDYYVAWLPAQDGVIDNDRQQTLAQFTYVPAALYLMHMSAVDAQGRLSGFTLGDVASINGPGEGFFRLFRAGAYVAFAATTSGNTVAPTRASFRAAVGPLRASHQLSPSQVKIRLPAR
jgi:hypothetical protein